jgi:hypothetical protein
MIEVYFLTVLEAGKSRIKVYQVLFSSEGSLSCCVLKKSFLVLVERAWSLFLFENGHKFYQIRTLSLQPHLT